MSKILKFKVAFAPCMDPDSTCRVAPLSHLGRRQHDPPTLPLSLCLHKRVRSSCLIDSNCFFLTTPIMPPKAINPYSLIVPSYKNTTTYASFLEEIIKSNPKRSALLTTENINTAWQNTSTKRHPLDVKAQSRAIEEANSRENRSLLDNFIFRYGVPLASPTASNSKKTAIKLQEDKLGIDEVDIETFIRKLRQSNAGRELSGDEIKDCFERYIERKEKRCGQRSSTKAFKELRRRSKAYFKGLD